MARPAGEGRKKKDAENAQKPSPYAERLAMLMNGIHDLLAAGGPALSQKDVWTIYENCLVNRGLGALVVGASTMGPWFGGGGRKTTTSIVPSSELGLAVFAQSLFSKTDASWGLDPDDLETPLLKLRTLLEHGPDVAPDPARFPAKPTAKQILASISPAVQEVRLAIKGMSAPEALNVVDTAIEHLRTLTLNMPEAPLPQPELPPEPPCNPKNPVWLALSGVLGLGLEVTTEAVRLIAEMSGLDAARTRQILCGADYTPDELERLAQSTTVGAERFLFFVESVSAKLAQSAG